MPNPVAIEKSRGDAHERILASARLLFMERGFHDVSTNDICKHAGVSKTSIYRYFKDMSGLLEDVVTTELEARLPEYRPMPKSRQELSESIYGIAHDVAEILSDPELLELDRMVLEMARTHPNVATAYHRIALELFHTHLGDLLKDAEEKGLIELRGDPYALADNLLSIWDGLGLMRVRLGLSEKPYEDMHGWFKHGVFVILGLEEIPLK